MATPVIPGVWQVRDGIVLSLMATSEGSWERYKELVPEDLRNYIDPWCDMYSRIRATTVEANVWNRFEIQGLKLWKRLIEELGAEYEVSYYSELMKRVLYSEPAKQSPVQEPETLSTFSLGK